jgi:hypothetical protein
MHQFAATPKILSPSFAIPLTLVLGALPVMVVQPYVGFALSIFGWFLMVQSATIRLHFTDSALDVYRSNNLIRHFPYSEWQSWRIFWRSLPILFYFKEVKSIHFLPMLFNAEELRTALNTHVPDLGK